MTNDRSNRQKAANIIRDAGGHIVGRTRLQKIAYLLELAGLGEGFKFEYKHYGPYSDELANATRMARAFGLIEETEQPTDWGGFYSTFRATEAAGDRAEDIRAEFAEEAARIGAIELELLATAAYLYQEGYEDPWGETAKRKPEKAEGGRLERARTAYKRLLELETRNDLPPVG